MKVQTPQIAFHAGSNGKNDPILSVDFHPSLNIVVTAGTDKEIRLWDLDRTKEKESPFAFRVGLQGHEKSVNTVRFSPDGTKFASCSDDAVIILFGLSKSLIESAGEDTPRETLWSKVTEACHVSRKLLRGHAQDVIDIAWSKDSKYLVSGSIDGSVLLWDVTRPTGKHIKAFHDHRHYVQGVAWDPHGNILCTESADRTVKVYHKNNKSSDLFDMKHDLSKRTFTVKRRVDETNATPSSPVKTQTKQKKQVLFLDDSVSSYFRRLNWSPDGSILFTPAGRTKLPGRTEAIPTTFAYIRGEYQSPALHFPGPTKATVGVRCNPVLFQLKGGSCRPWLKLPYRMVFAILSLNGVYIYDTQHKYPIAAAELLHFSQLTDCAWSPDGLSLVISSNDGYCSVISIDMDELGDVLPNDKVPEVVKRKLYAENPEEEKVTAPSNQKNEKEGDEEKRKSPEGQVDTPKRRITPVLVNEVRNKAEPAAERRITPILVTAEPEKPKRKIQPVLIAPGGSSETTAVTVAVEEKKEDDTPKKRRVEPTLIQTLPTT